MTRSAVVVRLVCQRRRGKAYGLYCTVGLLFILTMLFAWGAAAADAKRVVLLHSFGQRFQALERICQVHSQRAAAAVALAAGHH